jgi:amidase
MMSPDEYRSFDALGLAELVRKRQVTPAELLETAATIVDALNPKINAVVHRMEAHAKQRLSEQPPSGPLAGVPFFVKDLATHCKGEPTRNGSRLFADFVADFDSDLTRRYRAAGLVIIGKTNTPEMGPVCTTEPLLHGPTRNPWDLARSPGGSSGGSAAAVACGMVPAAHGSDSAGSIRIPASDCGLFGLMQSRGRISAGPAGDPLGVGRPHVMTRSVRDSAVLLDVSSGTLPGEPFSLPPPTRPFLDEVGAPVEKLRIAYAPASPSGEPVDPECLTAAETAARLCEQLGHHVEQVTPPVSIEPILESAPLLCLLRLRLDARARQRGRPLTPDDLEKTTWALYEYAGTVRGVDYAQAVTRVHDVAFALGAFFRNYDLLLTPVTARPPVPLGTFDMNRMSFDEYMRELYVLHMPFTRQFNFSGGPALSIPIHMTADGLPVGVQLGADVGRDDLLFRIAAQIETARPWRRLSPA